MAAATYSTFGLLFKSELPATSAWYYPIAFAALFTIQVVLISFLVEIADFVIDISKKLSEWLPAVFGITILTTGFLPLNNIGQAEACASSSPLWAFACLAWGFRIFLPQKNG